MENDSGQYWIWSCSIDVVCPLDMLIDGKVGCWWKSEISDAMRRLSSKQKSEDEWTWYRQATSPLLINELYTRCLCWSISVVEILPIPGSSLHVAVKLNGWPACFGLSAFYSKTWRNGRCRWRCFTCWFGWLSETLAATVFVGYGCWWRIGCEWTRKIWFKCNVGKDGNDWRDAPLTRKQKKRKNVRVGDDRDGEMGVLYRVGGAFYFITLS